MTLTLALSYGGREEIVRAAKELAAAVEWGELHSADIDEEAFAAKLWTQGLPDPELVVRTSGELRLSNFLLFQLAYAEIVVTEKAWPDYGEEELLLNLREYQRRERRFGMTGAQVKSATAK